MPICPKTYKLFLYVIAISILILPCSLPLNAATITGAEYYIDIDPGNGNGVSILSPVDGIFDSSGEKIELNNIDVTALTPGTHILYVRFKDSSGAWGLTKQQSFTTNCLSAAEYFFDGNDSGPGLNNSLPAKDNIFNSSIESVDLTAIDTSDLKPGYHSLSIRFKDSNGTWGIPKSTQFHVSSEVTIRAAEFFIDADPGIGQGIALTSTNGMLSNTIEKLNAENVSSTGYSVGQHTIYVRTQDSQSRWGIARSIPIEIYAPLTIKSAEVFVDNDPGLGKATIMKAIGGTFDSAIESAQASSIDTASLSAGTHTAFVRFMDNFNRWNSTSTGFFTVYSNSSPATAQPLVPGWNITDATVAGQPGKYYKIEVPSPSNVTLNFKHTNFSDSNIKWNIRLLDSNLTETLSFISDGLTPNITRDLTLAEGLYYITVSDVSIAPATTTGRQYGLSATISSTNLAGRLEVALNTPQAFRPGRVYSISTNISNAGNAFVPTPLLLISNNQNAEMSLSAHGPFSTKPIPVFGLNRFSSNGFLEAGDVANIPVYVKSPNSGATAVQIKVEGVEVDSSPVDWNALSVEARPANIEQAAWDIVWQNLKSQLGGTSWWSFISSLKQDAYYVRKFKISESNILSGSQITSSPEVNTSGYDIRELLGFEYAKASGFIHPRLVLAVGKDVISDSPGLSLTFGRFAPQPIESRFRMGPLGRGWSHTWEYTSEINSSSGLVTVIGPADLKRSFNKLPDGSYQGSQGDYAKVTVVDNIITMREKDGITWQFNSDGTLHYLVDLNGNKLTQGYTNGKLTSINHNNGDSLLLAYNANNRVSQVKDRGGQVTLYRYNGDHLAEVEHPGGIITRYSYNPADSSPSARALSSISYSDGTHRYYTYDNLGRLVGEHGDNGMEKITYAFEEPGTVLLTTNTPPSTIKVRYGTKGEVLEILDANGLSTGNAYDSLGQISRVIGPDGKSVSFTYDDVGNKIGIYDPIGNLVKMTFAPDTGRLTSLTDGRQSKTVFNYTPITENLKDIIYPDASKETFSYSANGVISSTTNRRLTTINNTTDEKGRIVRKDYPDGHSVTYTFDNIGNLTRASDSQNGIIDMEYDARNNMTKIDYPGGRGFSFMYDNNGKRTKRTNHDGDVVNYSYTSTGLLQALTNASGVNIVNYEYDDAGRLTKENKGNGTYTTYEFDPSGRLLQLTNRALDNSIQSYFNYTYDINNNITSISTLDGKTTYSYDAIGQLTGILLPNGRIVSYAYDKAGNRTTANDNGSSTSYTVNSLNQYTQVGGSSFIFDKAGNMSSRTEGADTTTYEYDLDGRLIKLISSDKGTWEYVYDALGNRSQVKHDGAVTNYLLDPNGFGDIAAEYNATGELITRYTHGIGLVSRVDASGAPAFYSYDAIGNTRQLTNMAGVVANNYSYLPFGEQISNTEQIPNNFTYVGRFGIMELGDGLQFMRARYYSPGIGRFVTPDPLRLSGGMNTYSYVTNSPLASIDPSGLIGINQLISNASKRHKPLINNVVKVIAAGAAFSALPVVATPAAVIIGASSLYAVTIGSFNIAAALSDADINYEDGNFFEDMGSKTKDEKIIFLGKLADTAVGWGDGGVIGKVFSGGIVNRTIEGIEVYNTCKERGEFFVDAFLLNSKKNTLDKKDVRIVRSSDPNEKVSSPGFGDQHYVSIGEDLSYTIYFENKSTASASAQEVFIDDTLDQGLDWSTFRLDGVGFGSKVVTQLINLQNGSTRVAYGNIQVDISAQFDPATGKASWTLRTIDPQTGQLPEDALAGFLPPENGTGRGQGYVSFKIRTLTDKPTETVINNSASIVFDSEAPIVTNNVFHTLSDALPSATAQSFIPENSIVPVSTILAWDAANFATSYDVYLWKEGSLKPTNPVITGATTPSFDPPGNLEYATTYLWQVVARNLMGGTPGPVWKFTTALEQFSLTVLKQGAGTGSVVSTETIPSIHCGATCYNAYNKGTLVTLNATADIDVKFEGWSGACTGTADCTITMDTVKNVVTTFTPLINGVCGVSNGGSFTVPPSTNLCAAGTPSIVTGNGPWNWSCAGSIGYTTASCEAQMQTWLLTATAGSNGSITPSTQVVNNGLTATYTITPNSGYAVVNPIGGTCPQGTYNSALTVNNYTTSTISTNCTVTPSFTLIASSISGTIVNATNNMGISGVTVNLAGLTTRNATTDVNGLFSFTGLMAGAYTLTSSVSGFITDTHSVNVISGAAASLNIPLSPVMSASEYRAVLSWGATPTDLDFHVFVPNGSGCTEVSYGSKGSSTNMPYTSLDVDVTTGNGPETITVKQQLGGTYQFWVNNYSSSPDITTSMATVKIYNGTNLVKTIDIPVTPTGNRAWHVFDLNPSMGQLTPVNTLAAELGGACTQGDNSFMLSTSNIGTGGGSVNSSSLTTTGVPSDVSCTSGTCNAVYPGGSVVNINATPNSSSTFEGWSGACTTDPCNIVMNAYTTVFATFNLAPMAKNISTGTAYPSLASALSAALSGAEIWLLDIQHAGTLALDKSIDLKGGWNTTYKSRSGIPSILDGTITVLAGHSTAENVNIKGKLEVQGGSLRVRDLKILKNSN